MTRVIRFDDRCEMPLMQRERVRLGLFAQAGPNNRATLLVHFHHVLPRSLLIKAKDLAKNHHDIRHEVNWIVEHNHAPETVQSELGLRMRNRRCMRILTHASGLGGSFAHACRNAALGFCKSNFYDFLLVAPFHFDDAFF